MKIERKTNRYNELRYGLPWIAKVRFEAGKIKYDFGVWIGDKGSEGLLVLDCLEPGDLYATGQKDFRNSKQTENDLFELLPDGTGQSITKVQAYKKFNP